jgi:hypothetical protein
MTAQKLPLFGGMISPIHVGVAGVPLINDIFGPPDKALKTPPRTYELHLWVMPSAALQGLQVGVTETATGKTSVAWSGISAAANVGVPQKVLDGYPVRGDVSVILGAQAAAVPVFPVGPQMWGYYLVTGQGGLYEEERRFIGQDLQGFNEGVPFLLAVQPPVFPLPPGTPSNAVIHTFVQGRIDEMSLAFTPFGAFGSIARLTFETKDNLPVIPGHFVDFAAFTAFGPDKPAFGAFPPSPYIVHKIPFGGGGQPLLDHLRVAILETEDPKAGLGVHGYFIRH